MATEPSGSSAATATVRDRREPPRGVLPRQLQMWLMAGLATVIVLVFVRAFVTVVEKMIVRIPTCPVSTSVE